MDAVNVILKFVKNESVWFAVNGLKLAGTQIRSFKHNIHWEQFLRCSYLTLCLLYCKHCIYFKKRKSWGHRCFFRWTTGIRSNYDTHTHRQVTGDTHKVRIGLEESHDVPSHHWKAALLHHYTHTHTKRVRQINKVRCLWGFIISHLSTLAALLC